MRQARRDHYDPAQPLLGRRNSTAEDACEDVAAKGSHPDRKAGVLLHEQLSLFGIIGIASIVLGILSLGLNEFIVQKRVKTGLFALLLGATIIVYSLVDKVGVGKIHPVFYIFWMFVISGLGLSPYVLMRHRDSCVDAWKTMKKYIVLIGPGSMATYLIILFTFQIGQVNYIVAVREFSVVVGSALGILFLKERYS